MKALCGRVARPFCCALLILAGFAVRPALADPTVVANDDATTSPFGQETAIAVTSNDSSSAASIDITSVAIDLQPTNGLAIVDSITGMIRYTPNAGFSGIDTMWYLVSDEAGNQSAPALVEVLVLPNVAPVLSAFSVEAIGTDTWLVSGVVLDELPEGCLVELGGVFSGHFAAVEMDGTFAVEVMSLQTGFVTGVAIDDQTLESNTESRYIN